MTPARSPLTRRRSFALIVTLLLVTLLATASAQLATVSSVEVVRSARRANTLQHELAVDSVIYAAAQRLRDQPSAQADLDRDNAHVFTITLGDCRVTCRMADDGAKFDVSAFDSDNQKPLLRRKLSALGRRFGLTQQRIRLRPIAATDQEPEQPYVSFDQFLSRVEPGAVFHWSGQDQPWNARATWSDVVSCYGSGPIDVRRARRKVLQTLFDDLDRSLAGRIIAARRKNRDAVLDGGDVMERILRETDAEIRDAVRSRIAYGLNRYALDVETAIRGDHRRWYVVATLDDGQVAVHYREQIQW